MAILKDGSTIGGNLIWHRGNHNHDNWSIKTGNYTARNGDALFTDTSSSSFTITLPSSPSIGDTVIISDLAGSFETHNLTVARNGQKINGDASDLVCDVNNCTIKLVFSNSTYGWKIQ